MSSEGVAGRPARAAPASKGARELSGILADPKVDHIRLRRLLRQVHALGPRPTGELLLELAGDHPLLIERLEAYAAWDPRVVRTLGAADWGALPLRAVA